MGRPYLTGRLHASPRGVRLRLVKRDHPRAIDRYIDYFGGATAAAGLSDPCGEALLDCLEPGGEDDHVPAVAMATSW